MAGRTDKRTTATAYIGMHDSALFYFAKDRGYGRTGMGQAHLLAEHDADSWAVCGLRPSRDERIVPEDLTVVDTEDICGLCLNIARSRMGIT